MLGCSQELPDCYNNISTELSEEQKNILKCSGFYEYIFESTEQIVYYDTKHINYCSENSWGCIIVDENNVIEECKRVFLRNENYDDYITLGTLVHESVHRHGISDEKYAQDVETRFHGEYKRCFYK